MCPSRERVPSGKVRMLMPVLIFSQASSRLRLASCRFLRSMKTICVTDMYQPRNGIRRRLFWRRSVG